MDNKFQHQKNKASEALADVAKSAARVASQGLSSAQAAQQILSKAVDSDILQAAVASTSQAFAGFGATAASVAEHAAGQSVALARQATTQVGTAGLDTAKAVFKQAQALSNAATVGAQQVSSGAKHLSAKVVDSVSSADHKQVAEQVENVSMGLGIASGVAAAGAALAAPTGLSAVGVALGLTSAPLIVTAAPVLGAVATAVGVASGGTYFYSKWQSGKEKAQAKSIADDDETPGEPKA